MHEQSRQRKTQRYDVICDGFCTGMIQDFKPDESIKGGKGGCLAQSEKSTGKRNYLRKMTSLYTTSIYLPLVSLADA